MSNTAAQQMFVQLHSVSVTPSHACESLESAQYVRKDMGPTAYKQGEGACCKKQYRSKFQERVLRIANEMLKLMPRKKHGYFPNLITVKCQF